MSTEPISHVSKQDLLFQARPDADEAQLEGQNYRVTAPWRPISGVAFYTLAALVGGNFTQNAWAAPVADGEQLSPIQSVGDRTNDAVPIEIKSPEVVVAPESFDLQEFTPEAINLSKSPSIEPVMAQDNQVSSFGNQVKQLENEYIQAQSPTSEHEFIKGNAAQLLATSQTEKTETSSDKTNGVSEVASPEQMTAFPERLNVSVAEKTASSAKSPEIIAQRLITTPTPRAEVERLQQELRDVENIETEEEIQASPALSIVIPSGFGLDNNTGFISATYQQRTRNGNVSDGGVGVGIGLGDARKAVGVELSYTAASFGGSRDFGAGGFNAKVHRQLGDTLSVAAGWNGFLNLGGGNDFENSIYGVATKILRTRPDINSLFSRVAVTAGVGSGQFRTEDGVAQDKGGVNVFGNVALRVAKPLSLIAEWSGQDLGIGASIAPFKNIPLVITPAVRDIVGAGDGPRFVLGTGLAFKF